jgi:hypothetical protein
MTKAITISLLIMLITVNTWGDENSYLEGISILGNKKVAYLSIEGKKIAVSEGEEIVVSEDVALGKWWVVRIEQGSILLKTKVGITKELRLDNRLPEVEEKLVSPLPTPDTEQFSDSEILDTEMTEPPLIDEVETTEPPLIDEVETMELPLIEETETPPSTDNTEISTKDSASHQVVRTPFGTFTVKNNVPPTPDKLPPIAEDEIPPGHHLVQTPFGYFIVKDKEDK